MKLITNKRRYGTNACDSYSASLHILSTFCSRAVKADDVAALLLPVTIASRLVYTHRHTLHDYIRVPLIRRPSRDPCVSSARSSGSRLRKKLLKDQPPCSDEVQYFAFLETFLLQALLPDLVRACSFIASTQSPDVQSIFALVSMEQFEEFIAVSAVAVLPHPFVAAFVLAVRNVALSFRF